MSTDRREFIERFAAGAVALTTLSAFPLDVASALGMTPGTNATDVDMSWTSRIKGKYRAVFDVPEIESSFGIWRSQLWGMQVQEAYKVKPAAISTVLVLRHNAIVLAMQQGYWDKYGIGKAHNVTHPITMQATERNPALLSAARGEIDEKFDALSLDKAIGRGTIVLACNLALEFFVVPTIAKKDGITEAAARSRAHELILSGIKVMPSGGFAAIAAQDAGCRYLRAS